MKNFSSNSLLFAAIAISVALAGCSTSRGFNRGELRESLSQAAVVDNEDVKKVLALKPQLPKPFRIGVYFVEPTPGRGSRPGVVAWRWSEADRDKIFGLADDLKATGEVSDVFPISSALTNGNDLRSVRLAAAKHGADAVLVVSGISDTDSYTNNAAWTYFLILPMLFAPGSQTDVLFITRATMWDVRNEFLYLSAEAESLNQRKSPLAFIEERPQIENAKREAVGRLSEELKRLIAQIQHGPQKTSVR